MRGGSSNLASSINTMDDCFTHKGRELKQLARQAHQRRVLRIVLALNAIMFVAEFGAGVGASSARSCRPRSLSPSDRPHAMRQG